MDYRTFTYKDYTKCSFQVGNYLFNPNSMFIMIVNDKYGSICTCTINKSGYLYEENTATIKNYSENTGMTDFLLKLGIIDNVITKSRVNMFSGENDTIDYCNINIKTLKKYSSKFEYNQNLE